MVDLEIDAAAPLSRWMSVHADDADPLRDQRTTPTILFDLGERAFRARTEIERAVWLDRVVDWADAVDVSEPTEAVTASVEASGTDGPAASTAKDRQAAGPDRS